MYIVAFLLALAAYIFAIPESHLLMLDNTRKVMKLWREGQILSNPPRLNPAYLSFANTAYRIQSQTLGIPDRFGIFSAGPPRLRVWEAEILLTFGVLLLLIGVYLLCMIFLFWMMGAKKLRMFASCCIGAYVAQVVLFWMLNMQRTGRRAPDYVWEDWSLEEERKSTIIMG